ncbi:MAG: TolC family protein [Zoogloea sp.]|nr:TolC family protein [Zoogloea sp.]
MVLALAAPLHAAEPAPVDPARLGLADAEARALARNRDIQLARRNLESAAAGIDIAGARPNATLSLSGTSIDPRHGLSGSIGEKRIDSVIDIEQPIERGGKRELRLAQADALLSAARADLADATRQQLLAVRLAYFDLMQAQARESFLRETAELLATTVDKTALRVKAGDLSPTDLERVRVDQLRAVSDLQQAHRDTRRARGTLAQLLAMEADAERLRAVGEWPQPADFTPPARPPADVVRPDVAAAQARLEAARQSRTLAERLQTRDVTVGAQFEHDPPVGRALVGFGISIPLFNGYDYRGEIRRAYTDLSSAEEQLGRVASTAGEEAARLASEAAEAAQRARDYNEHALPAARKAAQGVEFAYSHGAAGVLELLDARRTLRATELDAIGAEADYARARAGLAAALNQDF